MYKKLHFVYIYQYFVIIFISYKRTTNLLQLTEEQTFFKDTIDIEWFRIFQLITVQYKYKWLKIWVVQNEIEFMPVTLNL